MCFACLGHESCCCSRLSEAVFQGHVPRPSSERIHGRIDERTLLAKSVFYDVERRWNSCVFMDSKGDVRRVFLACVLHALGTNPAAVRSFRNRFSNWKMSWGLAKG